MKTSECVLISVVCGSYTKEKESILEYRPIVTLVWPECDSDLRWKIRRFFDSRGTIQSCLFSRINPNKRLGFLNTWFSSPILLDFLLSPQPYSQSFIRNPSVCVFRIFFVQFLSNFINPSKCLVFLELFKFDLRLNMDLSFFFSLKVVVCISGRTNIYLQVQ